MNNQSHTPLKKTLLTMHSALLHKVYWSFDVGSGFRSYQTEWASDQGRCSQHGGTAKEVNDIIVYEDIVSLVVYQACMVYTLNFNTLHAVILLTLVLHNQVCNMYHTTFHRQVYISSFKVSGAWSGEGWCVCFPQGLCPSHSRGAFITSHIILFKNSKYNYECSNCQTAHYK